MTVLRSKIIGTGSYLPEKVLTNQDLEGTVDTSDSWIQERTGIKERHIVAEDENTSDIAYQAALKAITSAKIKANDIDLIVLATTTPDHIFPATAAKVQALLGIKRAAAFDIQAVCSGFVFALDVADSMIKSGKYKRALVIGAETMSRILNWTDRNTCVLFGDGSGAVVLEGYECEGTQTDRGIIDTIIHTDGRHYEKLQQTGGISDKDRNIGYIHMEGKEVFKHAVSNLTKVAEDILQRNDLSGEDLDLFIPHQANLRIIDSTAKKLKFTLEKTIITVYYHANTSSASIPLAMDYAVRNGRLREGDLILLDCMGAGFTWGASLIRF